MKKLNLIAVGLAVSLIILGFSACSNANSADGGTGNQPAQNNSDETTVTSDRLILEAVDDGIQITIIGEAGWGNNTWVEDTTSKIDIFATTFDSDNKATFLYPFTEDGKTYSFKLYNQSSGTENYNSNALSIIATGGVGYPMSDAFKNTKVVPSHDSDGKFYLKFNTTATKFGDFFKVDIDLFTNGMSCCTSFGGGILFGYPEVCSMCSYSNLYMNFSSTNVDCVSGNYSKADNSREQCDNLFEKMKTTNFETWVFRDNVTIADFNNIYCAQFELQLWPNDSDIHYWIHGDYSERCDY